LRDAPPERPHSLEFGDAVPLMHGDEPVFSAFLLRLEREFGPGRKDIAVRAIGIIDERDCSFGRAAGQRQQQADQADNSHSAPRARALGWPFRPARIWPALCPSGASRASACDFAPGQRIQVNKTRVAPRNAYHRSIAQRPDSPRGPAASSESSDSLLSGNSAGNSSDSGRFRPDPSGKEQ